MSQYCSLYCLSRPLKIHVNKKMYIEMWGCHFDLPNVLTMVPRVQRLPNKSFHTSWQLTDKIKSVVCYIQTKQFHSHWKPDWKIGALPSHTHTHTHHIHTFNFQLAEPFIPRISNSMTEHTHNHKLLIKYFLHKFHFSGLWSWVDY
jgi:hypothetical protein